jgi:Dual OB-containing domain
MSYTKRIVCLANSTKNGGRCIAGREITETGIGPWIRPVSNSASAELRIDECSYSDGTVPKLLDLIDVPLLRPVPHNHQSENHLIDSSRKWTRAGRLPFAKIREMAEMPWTLWTNSGSTSIGYLNCVNARDAAKHASSLYLLWVTNLDVEVALNSRRERCCLGIFTLGQHQYRLNITDPVALRRLESLGFGEHDFLSDIEILLCISFTEPYVDRRCHKLIAAIIADPPL